MSHKKRILLVWLTSSVTLPAAALAQLLGDPLVDAQDRIQSPVGPQYEDRPIVCFSTATCPAYDLNCDNVNDGLDVAIMCCETNYGLSVDEASCPQADLDCDGIITGLDVALAVSSACTGAQQPPTDPLSDGVDQRDEPPFPDWSDRLRRDQPLEWLSERDEVSVEDWSDRLNRFEVLCDSQAPCPEADVNCDDVVTGVDVLMICSPENYGLPVDQAVCSRADVDCNGIVNGLDVALVTSSACMQPLAQNLITDPNFGEADVCASTAICPEADVNCDGVVDQRDLDLICDPANFGMPAAKALHPQADCDGDGYVTGLDVAMASSSACVLVPCNSTASCPNADLDCDNLVTGLDIAMMANSINFGLPVTEAAWPQSDLDGDGVITQKDIAIASGKCFGW